VGEGLPPEEEEEEEEEDKGNANKDDDVKHVARPLLKEYIFFSLYVLYLL